MVPTAEPQRLINARRFFLGYSKEHVDAAVQLLSPHVVYSVPGHSRISGVFHGPDEVRQHIVKLIDFSQGTFEVLKWMDWMVGETHIAAIQYAQAQSPGPIYRGHHLYLLESDPTIFSPLSRSSSKIRRPPIGSSPGTADRIAAGEFSLTAGIPGLLNAGETTRCGSPIGDPWSTPGALSQHARPARPNAHNQADQSPSGSVVWPTSIRYPSGSRM